MCIRDRVDRIGSAYEEYSAEADIINYQTPFKMRNSLMTMRLTYDITGDAVSYTHLDVYKRQELICYICRRCSIVYR